MRKELKKYRKGKKQTGGRNNTGQITVWHRGGGHKRKYRVIDWQRQEEKEGEEGGRLDQEEGEESGRCRFHARHPAG